MLPFFSLFLLALAVSLDGFGVGVTYGLRKIRIPLFSIAIISCCSGLIIFVSMQIGVWMSGWVYPDLAKTIGALILVGIGLWALYQLRKEEADSEEAGSAETVSESAAVVLGPASAKEIIYIELKRFGLVIQILRKPSIADMDRSGIISAYEATLLGLALSLDAFGAGIGAALLGFTPWLTAAVIALASGMFLSFGLRVGFRYAGAFWMRRLSVVPGFVLIIMGIMKLF
ncbi:putative sporulation protein YtaF [Paenibacillus sp. UNCCL117]|uniref:sporulation membrane protein YtaF n=1 Tax=unclassified Paenibacillus TaxID=185978 RepID=UPI00088FF2F3|nr:MULTISPECIES: sporulation membrane protein YtaF [unclassified Paenibacillus]SDC10181.1 putative sporulation protein YtaF [Paenibacillus sp. cl123]SFW16322.1 putative sporulation protein YtaF [Paenibacillus sp. UNCCL117]